MTISGNRFKRLRKIYDSRHHAGYLFDKNKKAASAGLQGILEL